jgi:transposase InsO family protein
MSPRTRREMLACRALAGYFRSVCSGCLPGTDRSSESVDSVAQPHRQLSIRRSRLRAKPPARNHHFHLGLLEHSVGIVGDAYDNALAESTIGLYKTELIRRRGPWRPLESVEYATLEWID